MCVCVWGGGGGRGGGEGEVVGKIHTVFVMMMTTEIIEHTHKTEIIEHTHKTEIIEHTHKTENSWSIKFSVSD